ncbi:MAG: YmdB family metallophosphoesterase, partial [bacterium]|nr:YmdB family metallophosphoesterase [bacterium]
PHMAPGNGSVVFHSDHKGEALIVNLQGRVFMEPVVNNPFLAIDEFLKNRQEKVIFVDFHAEATAEKQAMGFYLDGRVSAVLGTHTHVQTNDLRILEDGTAYQSDVGMTGSLDSVIGMKREPVIQKFVTGVNQRFEVARGNLILDFTVVDIDTATGRSVYVETQRIFESTYQQQLNF